MNGHIILEVISEWCREHNGKRNRRKIAWAMGTLIFTCILIGALTQITTVPWGIALFTAVIWAAFGPRIETVSRLTTWEGNRYVPDTLLLKLAEADLIPASTKAQIAQALKDDGYVTFESLFELDRQIAGQKRREDRSTGKGFQKMISNISEDGGKE